MRGPCSRRWDGRVGNRELSQHWPMAPESADSRRHCGILPAPNCRLPRESRFFLWRCAIVRAWCAHKMKHASHDVELGWSLQPKRLNTAPSRHRTRFRDAGPVMCVNKYNAESARGRPDRMAVSSSYRAELCVRRSMTLSAADPDGPRTVPARNKLTKVPVPRIPPSARLPNSEVIRITYVTAGHHLNAGHHLITSS